MASVKGIIVEIGGDTSKLEQALKKVNSTTAGLNKELRGINSLLKLDPKNTELVAQKQTVLKNNIEETSNKLNALRQAQEKYIESGGDLNTPEYRNLQREIINTENKLKNLQAQASKWISAGKSLDEWGNKIQGISSKVDKLGTNLTTKLTLPILGIATGLVNASKDFETAFTGVEKTVDGTADQMANLKQGIKNMAEELPSSTSEISAVAEAAGQLGIQTDNVLSFTKTMINMGNATNLSADEAATTLARFANVTQMSQADFDRLGSVIVALGNNFATTESEIADMGMNLASAGTQVGMTQPQIMALATALSSVGLEAQAGGTAFSKVMVNMQLAVEKGGDSLKDFASVAGMSSQEFQKAFKEDASQAIMQFINGLSKSGEQGKSAIKILDDMGITETRLRDALLRSANASGVMNKALDLSSKAWEENTALTDEADKRYQTLESRMQMTKNKILNVATNTGNKLTPTFNKLLDKVDGLVDKFDSLSDEEVENIVKTGALVAATGPAVKILGTFGKGIGTLTKGAGTLTQAIGLVGKTTTAEFDKASTATQNLAKVFTALRNPALLTVGAITAVGVGLVYFATKETEAEKQNRLFAEQIANTKASFDEYNQGVDDAMQKELAHINSVEQLKDELKTLVDENGKVKEGYEGRVSFILNELNNALGTEYGLTDGVIGKYKELQGEIDNLVEKKKAEAKINSEQQKYQNAIEQEETLVNNVSTAQDNLNKKLEEEGLNYDQLKQKAEEYRKLAESPITGGKGTLAGGMYEKAAEDIENVINAYEDSTTALKENLDIQKQYESDYALYAQQKYSEVGQSIKASTQDWTSSTINDIRTNIEQQKIELDKNKQYYEQHGSEIYNQRATQAEQNLAQLAEELANRTSTIQTLGEDEKNAWRTLATQSYENYKIQIDKMPPEMAQKIQDITGVIARDTGIASTMGQKGTDATNTYNQTATFKRVTEDKLSEVSKSMYNDTSVQNAAANVAERAKTTINNNSVGYNDGVHLVTNLGNGIRDRGHSGWFSGILSGVAGIISSFFKHSTPKKGPLSDDDVWTVHMMENFARGIKSNEGKVIKPLSSLASDMNEQMNIPQIQDFGNLQGALKNQIMEKTNTVFTTPQIVFNVQELDQAKLDQCFNYVNKKFGSKY